LAICEPNGKRRKKSFFAKKSQKKVWISHFCYKFASFLKHKNIVLLLNLKKK